MLGQSGMFEYLLMAIVLVVVVIGAMSFLIGFESSKTRGEESKEIVGGVLVSMGLLGESEMLTKNSNMFDDSKIVNLLDEDGCIIVKKLAGQKVCVEIDKTRFLGEDEKECLLSNFGFECNSWTICKPVCDSLFQKPQIGLSTPVNIYRTFEKKVELGKLTLRIPR